MQTEKSPTVEKTDNAGNSVNLGSGIIRLPSDWGSQSASETDVCLFFLPMPLKIIKQYSSFFFHLCHFISHNGSLRTLFDILRSILVVPK